MHTHTYPRTVLREHGQRSLGFALTFGSLICAGSYSALAKGLTPFLSPLSLLIVSEALTALFVLCTLGALPVWRILRTMSGFAIGMAAVIGLLNSVIAPLLWFYGLSQTTAVNAAILAPTDIICVLICGKWLLGERVHRMQIVGAATIAMGIVLLGLYGQRGSFGIHRGDVFILLATQIFGLGAILFKKYLHHAQPEVAIFVRNIAGLIVVLMASMFLRHPFFTEVSSFPIDKILPLLAFAFFARYLNLTFFYEAIERLPATTVYLIEVASPLVGAFFAVLLLGESITSAHIVGGTFIVLGLLIEQLSAKTLRSIKHKIGGMHPGHAVLVVSRKMSRHA